MSWRLDWMNLETSAEETDTNPVTGNMYHLHEEDERTNTYLKGIGNMLAALMDAQFPQCGYCRIRVGHTPYWGNKPVCGRCYEQAEKERDAVVKSGVNSNQEVAPPLHPCSWCKGTGKDYSGKHGEVHCGTCGGKGWVPT